MLNGFAVVIGKTVAHNDGNGDDDGTNGLNVIFINGFTTVDDDVDDDDDIGLGCPEAGAGAGAGAGTGAGVKL